MTRNHKMADRRRAEFLALIEWARRVCAHPSDPEEKVFGLGVLSKPDTDDPTPQTLSTAAGGADVALGLVLTWDAIGDDGRLRLLSWAREWCSSLARVVGLPGWPGEDSAELLAAMPRPPLLAAIPDKN